MCFGNWREVGSGSARGRRGGGGEAGDRAPRATLAPSVGRDRQLLSNRQRPEIYLKRGKGEENKGGGGGGERSRGESERAGRIRGSAGTSSAHICTPRDRWGEWIIFVSCRPFSSRLSGRGGGGEGGGGAGSPGESPPQGQRGSRCSHTETRSHESPGIFLLLSLLIIFYYSTPASERSAAPLPRPPAASLC